MTHTTTLSPARRAFRLFTRALSVFVLLILTYTAAATLLGLLPVNTDYRPTPGGVEVYVGTNGAHTDIIVPIAAQGIDWRARLPLAQWQQLSNDAYMAFGWGDRAFYLETPTWGDLKLSTALKALSGINATLMHVEAFTHPRPGPRMHRLYLSPAAYQRLVAQIETRFARDPSGKPTLIPGAHYRDTDAFFAANGHYSLFHTCNEWTRRTLASAGIRTPMWSPFQWAIMRHVPSD